MLNRSEQCGRRNAPDVINQLDSLCPHEMRLNNWIPQQKKQKIKRGQIVTKREFTRHREVCTENVRDSAQLWNITNTGYDKDR